MKIIKCCRYDITYPETVRRDNTIYRKQNESNVFYKSVYLSMKSRKIHEKIQIEAEVCIKSIVFL